MLLDIEYRADLTKLKVAGDRFTQENADDYSIFKQTK